MQSYSMRCSKIRDNSGKIKKENSLLKDLLCVTIVRCSLSIFVMKGYATSHSFTFDIEINFYGNLLKDFNYVIPPNL